MKIVKCLYQAMDGSCCPSTIGVFEVKGKTLVLDGPYGILIPVDNAGPVAGWGSLDGRADEIVRFADSEGLAEHLAQGLSVVRCWAIRRDELARIGSYPAA